MRRPQSRYRIENGAPGEIRVPVPNIGYEKPAQIALKAYREKIRLKEAALGLGFVTKASCRMSSAGGHDQANGRQVRV